MKPKQNVLQEAQAIVHGRGEKEYGHPRDNFQDQADAFTAYCRARGLLTREANFEPRDVAQFNILQKSMRQGKTPKRDNLVDIAGYALAEERTEE